MIRALYLMGYVKKISIFIFLFKYMQGGNPCEFSIDQRTRNGKKNGQGIC